MNPRVLGELAALFSLVCWSERSVAAPAPNRDREAAPIAHDLSDQGLRQFRAGDYRSAIESFKQAFDLSGRSSLLFNIAQAYRLTGDCGRARDYYQRYIESGLDPTLKPAVLRRVHEMDGCLARSADLLVSKTTHDPIKDPKSTATISASVSNDVDPARLVGTTNVAGRNALSLRTEFVAVGACAVLFGSTGILFETRARSIEGDLGRRFATGGTWDNTAQRKLDEGRLDRVLSIASFAAAGAFAIGATWIGVRAFRRQQSAALAPAKTANGSVIVGILSF